MDEEGSASNDLAWETWLSKNVEPSGAPPLLPNFPRGRIDSRIIDASKVYVQATWKIWMEHNGRGEIPRIQKAAAALEFVIPPGKEWIPVTMAFAPPLLQMWRDFTQWNAHPPPPEFKQWENERRRFKPIRPRRLGTRQMSTSALQISAAEFWLLAGQEAVQAPSNTEFLLLQPEREMTTTGASEKRPRAEGEDESIPAHRYTLEERQAIASRTLSFRDTTSFGAYIFRLQGAGRLRGSRVYRLRNTQYIWHVDGDNLVQTASATVVIADRNEGESVKIEALLLDETFETGLFEALRQLITVPHTEQIRAVFEHARNFHATYYIPGLAAVALDGDMHPKYLPRSDSPFWLHVRMQHMGLPMEGWDWNNLLHVLLYRELVVRVGKTTEIEYQKSLPLLGTFFDTVDKRDRLHILLAAWGESRHADYFDCGRFMHQLGWTDPSFLGMRSMLAVSSFITNSLVVYHVGGSYNYLYDEEKRILDGRMVTNDPFLLSAAIPPTSIRPGYDFAFDRRPGAAFVVTEDGKLYAVVLRYLAWDPAPVEGQVRIHITDLPRDRRSYNREIVNIRLRQLGWTPSKNLDTYWMEKEILTVLKRYWFGNNGE